MEFLPGAFEREWERRRAAVLQEMKPGGVDSIDWDEPRRGGVARLLENRPSGFGPARVRRGLGARRGLIQGSPGPIDHPMRTRFLALACGSQAAVVKLASYGGGARAAAMMSYMSRGGELAAENERGERVLGKEALAAQRTEWAHLFDNRAASRDLGLFQVTIDGTSFGSGADRGERASEILRSGFGDRRFVYAFRDHSAGKLEVNGVVVLRDRSGERLTGDSTAAEIIQERYDHSDAGQDVAARFRFHGYGNGVEWGTARVRELVARSGTDVRDDTGRLISGSEQAGDIVQKEWRKELHSRKGRDVMHLIVSARAGTDASAFESAVREFLGDQFVGHRYVFAIHDPSLDPKGVGEGGRRPHIHAHAIVTMRSETGGRIDTSPRVFRQWRSLMAEKAREQGIDMELTDRRELASAPAYTRNHVRPLNYRGRTEHEGTSEAAHARYESKRANTVSLAGSDPSRQYAAAAVYVWNELSKELPGTRAGAFATLQKDRMETAALRNIGTILFGGRIEGEVDQMREMTRPEFEAYEKRVEAALASVERTLGRSERADFDEIAAAAREIVDIRRAYLEFTERQAGVVMRTEESSEDRSERSRGTGPEAHKAREARGPGADPSYHATDTMAESHKASVGRNDAIGQATISTVSDAAGRDLIPYEQERDADRSAPAVLAGSGNLVLRDEPGGSQVLGDAMLQADARQAIKELRAVRSSIAEATREGQNTDRLEVSRDEAIDRATKLALEGNRYVRHYAEQDQELKEAIATATTEAARNEAMEVLDEVDNYRHSIRLAEDTRYAARFSSITDDFFPGYDIDPDAERRSLDAALERAGRLGISGNRFLLEAAERDPALRQAMERLEREQRGNENGPEISGSRQIGWNMEERHQRERDDRDR